MLAGQAVCADRRQRVGRGYLPDMEEEKHPDDSGPQPPAEPATAGTAGRRAGEPRAKPPDARHDGGAPGESGAAEPVRVFRGTGIYAPAVTGFVLAAALVILVAQNTQRVVINWLGWSITAPTGAVVLAAVLAGSLLTAIAGLLWRRNQRRVLSELEELRRLRAAEEPEPQSDTAASSGPGESSGAPKSSEPDGEPRSAG